VTPGSCGCANYTREQLAEIVGAYAPKGWPVTSRATPEEIADLEVRATFLAGRQVYAIQD
jgi:predicted amidohydrolase YtcJ